MNCECEQCLFSKHQLEKLETVREYLTTKFGDTFFNELGVELVWKCKNEIDECKRH